MTAVHSPDQIVLPKLLDWQREVIDHPARFKVLNAARRSGKTVAAKMVLAYDLLRGKPVAYMVPTDKMLADVWEAFCETLHSLIIRKSERQKRLILSTGGILDMWSLENYNTIRGRKYAGIVIDEAAMVSDGSMIWNAVLMPTLADMQGWAMFLSTPKGRNWFFDLYNRGLDPENALWKSWTFQAGVNPLIAYDEIKAAKAGMPERFFRQEWLAEFIEDAGTVFRGVLEVATAQPQEPQHPGSNYVMGVDWGRVNDFTVICVLDKDTRTLVHLERFNQIDWTLQRGRLRTLCNRYRPTVIIAESNSIGEPNIEELRKEGLPVRPFQTTQASKAQVIDALALAIEQKDITLLNDPVLIAELQSYEMERLPGGSWRYNAPSGGHDDCVMALALAYSVIGQGIGIWF